MPSPISVSRTTSTPFGKTTVDPSAKWALTGEITTTESPAWRSRGATSKLWNVQTHDVRRMARGTTTRRSMQAPGQDDHNEAASPSRMRQGPMGDTLGFMKRLVWITALAALIPSAASPQGYDPSLFAGLRWRLIGPFRGGRTVAAAGVPGRPNLFYIGVNNGGVWKTTDYGRIWTPTFDAESTGSIGAIAIAPSDPRIIYVGSGEGLQRPDLSVGDGIYKSTDGGNTWRHLGLRDGQQIPALIVDPQDPNRVLAAVLGHPYGANDERGIFRSTDGGETWQKVLYRDENTGAMDLAFSPANPQ